MTPTWIQLNPEINILNINSLTVLESILLRILHERIAYIYIVNVLTLYYVNMPFMCCKICSGLRERVRKFLQDVYILSLDVHKFVFKFWVNELNKINKF